MKMGRERAVFRWDIRSALLSEQIARTERVAAGVRQDGSPREAERVHQLHAELAELHRRMAALGPSPRARMG